MSDLFDFTKGNWFLKCIGAAWRSLFSKEKYAVLLKDDLSASYGQMILLILLLIFLAFISLFGF
jgi:hypothetical protein